MVNHSPTVEEILTQTLGTRLLRTSLKGLEQQRLYWLSALPEDSPPIYRLRWPREPAPISAIPTVPHYPRWADSLPSSPSQRPGLIAPILEVGMLHLHLLFEGFKIPIEQLSILAAKGGTFAKYVPEDMDSISAEGSRHNRELKYLMHQHTADVLLGGSPWAIEDFVDYLANTYGPGNLTPKKHERIWPVVAQMPNLAQRRLLEEYAICLTHQWGLNASVWALRNLRSSPATTFPYQFPLSHSQRTLHEQA